MRPLTLLGQRQQGETWDICEVRVDGSPKACSAQLPVGAEKMRPRKLKLHQQ